MNKHFINYITPLALLLTIMGCDNKEPEEKYKLKGTCLEAYNVYINTLHDFDHEENTIKIEQAKKQTKIRLSKTSEEQCRNILTTMTESAK
ncbi:hypothetical protein [Neisseria sp. Ec49-e6-T10]|uniref:hypothetical protein n=1 Tax=Neisseria sp. Ec49-e6-T10 TaxID=3140744 RepID=UPI003EBD9F76